MKWEIKYYLNESAKRSNIPAFVEVIESDKNFAERWAQNKIKHSNFVAFELIQK